MFHSMEQIHNYINNVYNNQTCWTENVQNRIKRDIVYFIDDNFRTKYNIELKYQVDYNIFLGLDLLKRVTIDFVPITPIAQEKLELLFKDPDFRPQPSSVISSKEDKPKKKSRLDFS